MRTRSKAPISASPPQATRSISRRRLLQAGAAFASGALASALTACRTRYVEIPRIVEREVVKVVTQIVRQTVIVPATPKVETPQATPPPPVTEPAPASPLTITLDGIDRGWNVLARRMVPAFQELFPGSQPVWRSITPWPSYADRIGALAAAGDLGDVIEAPLGTPLLLWAKQGILQPLDELVRAESYDLQGVFPAALSHATHDGHLYGVPLTAHPGDCLILANGDLVNPNLIYEQDGTLRLDMSGLVQSKSQGTGYLFLDDLALPAGLTVLGAFGAQWLSVWGTQPRLHTSASLEALTWAAEIRREGIVPPRWRMTATPERLFGTGQAAILRTSFAGLWLLHRTDLLPRHARIGLMPVKPSPGSVAPTGQIDGVAYCLTNACRDPSLALQWLKFMTTREMGVQMLLGGYGAPGARLAAWLDPRVLDHLPACAILGERCAAIDAPPLPWNLTTSACFHAWNRHIAALWDPETQVREWAADTERAITEILGEPRERARPIAPS